MTIELPTIHWYSKISHDKLAKLKLMDKHSITSWSF